MADELLKVMLGRAEEEQLRDMWNKPVFEGEYKSPDGNIPLPKPPSPKFPKVIGRDLARQVKEYFKLAPNLSNKFSEAIMGPNEGVIKELIDSKLSPFGYEGTNLMGLFQLKNRGISVNPITRYPMDKQYMDGEPIHPGIPSMPEVLAHELTHAAGYNGEDEPEKAEQLVKEMLLRKK